MSETVSTFLLRRLRAWGVEQVFGYPGDGINGVFAAWAKDGAKDNGGGLPRFVQARHEEMAAFEAVGYAKFSGRLGACTATSGPGAVHLLNGLYDALLDHVPVLAVVGQTNRSAMGGAYQQEVDLMALFKDVCSNYLQMLTVPEQLPNLVDRAVRTALSRRVPTCIIVPYDVQELEYRPPPQEFKMVPSSLGATPARLVADEAGVRRAAEVLNAGRKVAILAGQGARGAAGQLLEVAEALGAGVAKALLGKDVLADDLGFVTGSIGLLGTRPSYEMMRDCDTLLTVGSSFPYSQFLPPFGQARGVQIDSDASVIGMRYPYEVNLVGDAAATLEALLPLLERKKDRSWRAKVEANVARWWETMERQAMTGSDVPGTVNPQRLVWELSSRLPQDAIVSSDSGSAANWYARHLKLRAGQRASLSGTLATMGPGVPYAIGAKFAFPGRPAVALVGDGAMQMNGMAELVTAARYWQDWEDPRLVVAVLHNNDLNQVTWEMRAMGGFAKYAGSQSLPDVAYAAFAEGIGLRGVEVTHPDEVAKAWEQAFSSDRPTVLDVRTDPNVPPIPPHATWEQMTNTAKALASGDEDAWEIIKTGVRQKAQEVLRGTKKG